MERDDFWDRYGCLLAMLTSSVLFILLMGGAIGLIRRAIT